MYVLSLCLSFRISFLIPVFPSSFLSHVSLVVLLLCFFPGFLYVVLYSSQCDVLFFPCVLPCLFAQPLLFVLIRSQQIFIVLSLLVLCHRFTFYISLSIRSINLV